MALYSSHHQRVGGNNRIFCSFKFKLYIQVEYVASSHSKTACPEEFEEFYNQRRRWTPSTLANQWDLLKHSWVLIKYGNTNIVHMAYLLIMILAGLIGPGSVFLLLVGGLHMALEMGLWASFALNAALATIFFVVSMFFAQKYQLIVAKILSVLYGIVMLIIMVVLVIEAVRLRDYCAFTPTTTTLIIVASVYIFAGLLHPTQWKALPWGVIYYLTIPSMYFFLTFYCLFNLRDKSWGTRETSKAATKSKNPWKQLIAEIRGLKPKDDKEEGEKEEEKEEVFDPEWTNNIEDQLRRRLAYAPSYENVHIDVDSDQEGNACPNESHWKAVCDKLKPLGKNKERDDKIDKDLQTLQVNAVLVFLFCNIAFVFAIFLMQVRFDNLERFAVDWPLCELNSHLSLMMLQNTSFPLRPNSTHPITPSAGLFFDSFMPDQNTRETAASVPAEDVKYMQLDPINLIFMIFFLGVMFFQLLGMVFHRVRNAGHLMATINWPWTDTETRTPASSSTISTTSSGRGSNQEAEGNVDKIKLIKINFLQKSEHGSPELKPNNTHNVNNIQNRDNDYATIPETHIIRHSPIQQESTFTESPPVRQKRNTPEGRDSIGRAGPSLVTEQLVVHEVESLHEEETLDLADGVDHGAAVILLDEERDDENNAQRTEDPVDSRRSSVDSSSSSSSSSSASSYSSYQSESSRGDRNSERQEDTVRYPNETGQRSHMDNLYKARMVNLQGDFYEDLNSKV